MDLIHSYCNDSEKSSTEEGDDEDKNSLNNDDSNKTRMLGMNDDDRDAKRARTDKGNGGTDKKTAHQEDNLEHFESKDETCPHANQDVKVVSFRDAPIDFFVRSRAHIPGNWAGHVYLPLLLSNDDEDDDEDDVTQEEDVYQEWKAHINRRMDHIVRHVRQERNSCRGTPMTIVAHDDPKQWHISLTRQPFFLQVGMIDSFVRHLKQHVEHLSPTCVALATQPAVKETPTSSSSGLILKLSNDEQTRLFWSQPLEPNPVLHQILQGVNQVMKIYQQPTYYDPPIFHISLASTATMKRQQHSCSLTKDFLIVPGAQDPSHVSIQHVCCSFGGGNNKKVFVIPLSGDALR